MDKTDAKTEKFDPEQPVDNANKADRSEEERMTDDIKQLRALFPDLTPEDIPEEVWQSVSAGESLAASYALFYVKQLKEEERIEKVNRENEKKALGRIKQDKGQEEYFSPETVQKMSPAEVRKHYAAILKSMDSWN